MFSPSLLPGEVAFPAVRGVGRVRLPVLDFLPDRLLVLVRRLMAKAKEMPTECLLSWFQEHPFPVLPYSRRFANWS